MAKPCPETMYAYCLFCERNRCEKIAAVLAKSVFQKAFSPKIINNIRIKGEIKEEEDLLLPGYVFAFSQEKIRNTAWVYRINGVFKLLGRPENDYCLENNDASFAFGLLDCLGIIEKIHVIKKNNDYIIDDKHWVKDSNVKIILIDKRKKRAKVEFAFDKSVFVKWIAIEYDNTYDSYIA